MRPVVFDDCFGWIHPAGGTHGVVLCNPFGYDALCTHRNWRRLAERLATAGMPTLRFDYPGAGDSAGNEDDPRRVDAAVDSVVNAVRTLREQCGVTRVSLVGVRLGALYAALAAERIGTIDDLVLLAPVVVGRNYLRELRAHRQSWLSTPAGINADPLTDPDAYVEAFGFGLYRDDIAQLGAIDLRRATTRPAARVMLLDSTDRPRVDALAAHYAEAGCEVERGAFDESDKFLIEALYSEEPVDAFGRVAQWLAAGSPAPVLDARMAPAAEALIDPYDAPMLTMPDESGAVTERPVTFGTQFGIYCAPAHVRADAPALLFINTGASHHIGDGRIFVLFARRLASLGIASLRMDLAGLGDATPATAPSDVTLDSLHAASAIDSACEGADWLVAHGHARVVTFGVCAGAYVSVHANARHPAIAGGFAVNLQKMVWQGVQRTRDGSEMASSKVYWRSAFTREKWSQALRGQSNPMRAARVVAGRMTRRLWLRATGLVEARTGLPLTKNPVRDLLRAIEAKAANVRLVYGEFDIGLDEARVQFGANLDGLKRYAHVSALTLPKLDHALFTRPAREIAMQDAEAWLMKEMLGERAISLPPAASDAASRNRFNGIVPAQESVLIDAKRSVPGTVAVLPVSTAAPSKATVQPATQVARAGRINL